MMAAGIALSAVEVAMGDSTTAMLMRVARIDLRAGMSPLIPTNDT
jgi:hypothetical protein